MKSSNEDFNAKKRNAWKDISSYKQLAARRFNVAIH